MDAIFTKTDKDIARVKHNKLWFKRATVDFPLTDEQYEIFKNGYSPDWDCRFEPVYMDGWFYITRSGYWLFKFKYEKKKDGLWHITANYDTWHTPGFSVMLNVISEGYFEPPIFTERDVKRYLKELKNTPRMPLPTDGNPHSCAVCHGKVKNIGHGGLIYDRWRTLIDIKHLDDECLLGENKSEWVCPTCGQVYKDTHDEWNAHMCYIIYSRRPKVCKKCGGKVLEIVYGYPSHETFKMAERGEIVLGGCCIKDDQPDMVCRDCHQEYKKFVPDYLREDIFPDLLGGYRDEPNEGNGDEGAAMDLLTEDFGALEAKIMGVYGAMVRGSSKEEALKKYGLTEKEYEEGYSKVFDAND